MRLTALTLTFAFALAALAQEPVRPNPFRDPATKSPADAAKGDQKLKELFFFDMLEKGIWIARRAFMALCLPLGEAEFDKLAHAVEEFLSSRRSLLAVD